MIGPVRDCLIRLRIRMNFVLTDGLNDVPRSGTGVVASLQLICGAHQGTDGQASEISGEGELRTSEGHGRLHQGLERQRLDAVWCQRGLPAGED